MNAIAFTERKHPSRLAEDGSHLSVNAIAFIRG
jgi:hypothetical protein